MKASAAGSHAEEGPAVSVGAGSQTLMRGLDVVEALSVRPMTLADLAERLGLTRSTTHRLASALVDRGYVASAPRAGYRLGPKLLELGSAAQAQIDVVQVARAHMEALSASTEDAVHLGVLDNDQALYLDKIPGARRITISSRVGDRQPLTSTGLGKALILDHRPAYWMTRFETERAAGAPAADPAVWHQRMAAYVKAGRAFDLEENEDQIRCVAAPIRDATRRIVAAISVSSAAQYMSDERMERLSDEVVGTARRISLDLGWSPGPGD